MITPKREELNLQFLQERKLGEVYYADRPVPVQAPGPYTIQLTVRGGARFRTTSTHRIFVHSFPYLEPLRPISLGRYPLNDGLGVELVLKRDHAPTDPEREFEEHPNNLILAQLLPSPGSSSTDSPAIWLDRQGNRSTFRGTIRHPFRQAGLYSVAFQLVGTPRIGDRLRPPALIEQVDFWVQPSRGQQLLRGLRILLVATLVAGLIWGTSLALWLARSPKTLAQLEVRRDGEAVFTRYMNAGWLGPMRTPDPGSGPGQAQGGPALTFWVRAQGPDRLCMVRGGTLSLLTFGRFSRRVLAQRNEETDLDADHRVIFN